MDHPSKRRRLAPKIPEPPLPPATPVSGGPASTPTSHHHTPLPYASEQLLQLQHGQQQYQAPEPAQVPERHDFESFARHLQDAAMLIYRQTQRSPYSSVSVLLLRWEEDASVEEDLCELEAVLRERYNYHTDKWTIPTVPNPSIKLGVQMASFLEHARPDHLLIIYYAGHGYVGADNHLYWACHKGEDAAKLKWDGVRCLVEDAQSDMLLLLDTCAPREAATAGSHGVKQAIAAYTSDRVPRQPQARSFTSLLVEVLAKLVSGRPFTIQRLYDELAALQQKDSSQRGHVNGAPRPPLGHDSPPVPFTLTPGKGQSISLPVLPPKTSARAQPDHSDADADSTKKEDHLIGPEDVADLTFDEARALVCTTFVGDASPDMSFFYNWIRNAPAVAPKISVEGMFLGPPTMLLISMPQSVWNVVQHDKVCCFLGHITSHNMTHLYQRLVGSSSINTAATAKDVADGRMLLEAREAAAGSPTVARHEPRLEPRHEARHEVRHEPGREPGQEARQEPRPETRHEASAPATNGRPFHSVTPTRPRDGPRHGLPSSAPNSASNTAPSAAKHHSSASLVAKDEVEDSAEMKEAAEQLKALSHLGHTSGEATAGSHAKSAQSDGKHEDSGSSHGANDSGGDEGPLPSELSTPPAKPKQRRSLQKHTHTPKQETRCSLCSHAPFKDSSSLRKHIAAAHTRPFPCAFSFAGCTSTFGSKNEWKRHITSQHLCLQFYRCSDCPLSAIEGKGNEFNRKDLFTQHLRRMHAPFAIKKATAKSDGKMQAEWETHVKDMQQSCLVTRRKPPQRSACPKPDCQSVFEGPGSWDEWTEHVGRHMEKGEGQRIGVDRLLAKWALDEGIIERKDDGEYRLCNQDGVPGIVGNGAGHGNGNGAGPGGGEGGRGRGTGSAGDGGGREAGGDGSDTTSKRESSNINASSSVPPAPASDTRSETPPSKYDDEGSIVVATTAPLDDQMDIDD